MIDRLYEEDKKLIIENGWLSSEVIMARFLLMAARSLGTDTYEVLLLLCRQMVAVRSTGTCSMFRPDSVERCLSCMKEIHND